MIQRINWRIRNKLSQSYSNSLWKHHLPMYNILVVTSEFSLFHVFVWGLSCLGRLIAPGPSVHLFELVFLNSCRRQLSLENVWSLISDWLITGHRVLITNSGDHWACLLLRSNSFMMINLKIQVRKLLVLCFATEFNHEIMILFPF